MSLKKMFENITQLKIGMEQRAQRDMKNLKQVYDLIKIAVCFDLF